MRSRWAAATALVLAVTALGAVAERPAAGSGPRIAAHRGGARLWPENSLLAFRNALALGVDFVETDVHLTADVEPVVPWSRARTKRRPLIARGGAWRGRGGR